MFNLLLSLEIHVHTHNLTIFLVLKFFTILFIDRDPWVGIAVEILEQNFDITARINLTLLFLMRGFCRISTPVQY